jgi:competence protein ComEA
MSHARADPPEQTTELPADQQWEDVSADPPDPPPPEPWWRRGFAGRLMEHWAPSVVDVRRRRLVAVALAVGLVLAVLVAVGIAVSSPGIEHEAPPVLPMAAASPESTPAAASIVVSVVGQVTTPGLVTLPDGARVADALLASGGASTGVDLGPLNLARRLADGEQIYVGIPTPAGADPASAPSAGLPGAAAQVDLNSATLAALDTLPGVGPVTAQRIVDWRTEHGRFDSVNQLREVDGIGPGRFEKLKDAVVAR